MKKMGDTQAGLVNDATMKQALNRQLTEWEENLEKLVVEQFLFRCYLSALQEDQLPPPRVGRGFWFCKGRGYSWGGRIRGGGGGGG